MHRWLFDDALSVADARPDRRAHGVRDPARLATWCSARCCSLCNLVFDYARIRIVVEDRRSAIGALAGRRAVRPPPLAAALRLYLLNGAAFLLLVLLYALARPGRAAVGRVDVDRRSASAQLYIVGRHYVKLLFYASETAFFQGALAHAAYTAAPAGRLAGFAGGGERSSMRTRSAGLSRHSRA